MHPARNWSFDALGTRLIPRWLTSHRAVLVALLVLAVVAFVVSLVDSEFAYRPGQLALSLLVLVVVCGAVTYACAAMVRVPPGAGSWLITALILFFILPGVTDAGSAWTVAVGAAAAAASKYVLVWRRRLVVNPAVAGAVVVYGLAYAEVGSIGFPQWWVAAEPLLIPMIVIGVLLVTVLREWWLVAVFLVAAVITIGVVDATQGGQSLSLWLTSSPMLFVAAIMLPEPMTSPTTRWHRGIYAAIVGVLMYWQVSIPVSDAFSLEFVPEIALLVGSLYAFAVRLVTRNPAARRAVLAVTPVAWTSDSVDRAPNSVDWAPTIAANTHGLAVTGPAPLTFRPGQWAVLSAPEWSAPVWRRTRRVFSYASPPDVKEARFAFTVSGDPSSYKASVISGRTRRLYLDSSGGDFVLPRNLDRPIVLLASGIGITPFRAMILAALGDGRDLRRWRIVHVIRSADRAVFTDVLDAARDAGAQVEVVESSTLADQFDDGGRLVTDLEGSDHGAPRYYVSGGPAFVRTAGATIRRADPRLRWEFWRLHTDTFLGY
ncbi:oxidoreductase [Gordonia sp. CPCC 205515]|uniref:FAD-dependent oxidoreductase n=1 Tax=Gordonia sp. CPCC 205515 TaxID=3140791 RepID=UPI003AF3765E